MPPQKIPWVSRPSPPWSCGIFENLKRFVPRKRLRRTLPDWIHSRDSARNGGAWGKFEFTGGSTLAAASSRQLHGDLILPAARDILGNNGDLRHRILRFAPSIGIAIELLALGLHIRRYL